MGILKGCRKELKVMFFTMIHEFKKLIGWELLTKECWVKVHILSSVLAFSTYFVESYIWNPSGAYFTFIFLLVVDFIAAVKIAFKNKDFQTRKATRILYKLVGFTALFAIAFNLAKNDPFFGFLPELVYFPAVLITLLSFVKHLSTLNILPEKLSNLIIKNIDIYKDKVKKDDTQ